MKQVFLVFIGGGLGSVARYWLSIKLNNFENAIPYGTLAANILGSLIIGLIFGIMAKTGNYSEKYTLLLATGFCGGFTTYSTFIYENYLFVKDGNYFNFLPYLSITFILGFAALFLGLYLAKIIT